MVNRDSRAYTAGRFVGRIILIKLGYVLGKPLGRRPIEKGFPQKK